MVDYEPAKLIEKWLPRWSEAHIFEPEANPKQNKFLIHFAYPGISGYLHVGHMRGFTYSDIIARYKRMTGFDVLFPAGFHASGIPSIGFAKEVERKDELTLKILREYGCSEDLINTLTDPIEVVKYFGNVYIEDYWKKFGLLIDYSRVMSTISEGYKKFIKWQFNKLKEKNYVIKGKFPVVWCSKDNCAVGDHARGEGEGETTQDFIWAKFKLKVSDLIIRAGTTRLD